MNKGANSGEGTSGASLISKVPPLLPRSPVYHNNQQTHSTENNTSSSSTHEDTGRPSESQMQLGTSKLSTMKSDDAPFSTFQLLGVSKTLIPVSALDLIFKRFDMLQEQLDELKSLGSRENAMRNMSITSTPVDTDRNDELVERISTLQGLIGKQSSSLLELRNKCDLLLEENFILKEKLNTLSTNFDVVQGSHRELNKLINVNNINNCSS